MKKKLFVYSSLFIVGSFLACKKDPPAPPTIITGTVTNKTTGEPVAGAYLDCAYTLDNGRPKDISTYSDFEGKYQLEIPVGHSFSFSNAFKNGFLPKVAPSRNFAIQVGEVNIIDVALIPNDGYLRLVFQNDVVQNDSLYLYFFNHIKAAQYALNGWVTPDNLPFVLTPGGSSQKVFAFPSEAFTTYHWGNKAFIPDANSLRDSVYLLRNDTTDIIIHF
jgi:hypothetical protein